jgi:hypothetical protein
MGLNSAINNLMSLIFYVLIFSFVFFGVIYWIFSFLKKRGEAKDIYNLTFLQIKLPKNNEIEIEAAEHMFSNLMGFKKTFWKALMSSEYRISFEIVSKQDGIGFYVVVPDDIVSIVEKQINAAYPSAEIDIVNPHEVWDRGEVTRVAELSLRGPAYYPIKVYEELKNDSLSSITSAMSKMGPDEVVAVQYVIQPAPDSWRLAGRKHIATSRAAAADPEKPVNVDTNFLEGIEKKINQPGFYTKIRLVSIAKDSYTAQNHIMNLQSSFEQFTDPKYNRFVLKTGFLWGTKKIIDDFIFRRIAFRNIRIPLLDIQLYLDTPILNTVELCTVFHFPNKEISTPNIIWLTARRAAVQTNTPTEGLYLGKNLFRGMENSIYMKEKDRARHFYIIGQTGTGKSVFLMELALQDIMNGEGLAVIDPHGTDIEELLTKIPPERLDDVIYWDVSDTERPMGLNLLEASSEEEKHMVINSFIALLYKMYDPNRQGIMGPQLERAIRNVMLTAMTDPNSTMVDVLRLLIDPSYAQKFIDKVDDPLVKRFWTDEMAKTSDFHKSEKMGYFVSKFDRFVTDQTMRNILGQPNSSFNIEEIMANKKILLVDLAKGKIGEENSTFLGLILVPKILTAALSRHVLIGKQDFPNFYLYVDEFQNFATPDFETILSEARKYKLNLIIAHQFIEQLPEDIQEAVFGNIGTMCTFRIGADDAEVMENYYGPVFTKQDLSNLPVGNCYVRLLVDGHPMEPFSMFIDWEDVVSKPKSTDIAQRIKEQSRNKYGVPKGEVEEYINARAGFNEPEPPPLPKLDKKKIPF